MSRFLSDRFASLTPYTPGEQPKTVKNLIKLNTNESPFEPSPKVVEAVNAALARSLNLYCDPLAGELVSAIAAEMGVSEDMITVGNGSDEILAFAFLAFCDKRRSPCFADITYGFYAVFCELYGLTPNIIPLREDFSVEPSDYFNLNMPIFIANPNAPTSLALTAEQIESILKSNPDSVVLIDEAYVDFGAQSCVPLTKKYDNLIVCRTFSKSRSLAGARLGFAVASSALTSDLMKMKFSFNPYNVNSMTAAAGCAAVRDREYFDLCVKKIIENREYTAENLRREGFFVADSRTNFLFARPSGISGEEYFTALRRRGILVRRWDSERINDFVRITVGSREQMTALIDATREILKEAQ